MSLFMNLTKNIKFIPFLRLDDSAYSPRLIKKASFSISKGSLSFAMASRLLPKKIRHSIFLLYFWCRTCDDMVDEIPANTGDKERSKVLRSLIDRTNRAIKSDSSTDKESAFAGLGQLFRLNSIPTCYALDLIEGMKSDLSHEPVRDEQQLSLYCYQVAGTVGLMFTHISGVSEAGALRTAMHLGMAMQLTNIARDVMTDFENKRCYLPENWLEDVKLKPLSKEMKERPDLAFKVVERVLVWADQCYEIGNVGIHHLPLRVAFAVQAASNIYRDIGRLVRDRRDKSWEQRLWVSTPRKLYLVARAIGQVLLTIPWRMHHPHSKAQLPTSSMYNWERVVKPGKV
jgi:15-cis-phytoene synthase